MGMPKYEEQCAFIVTISNEGQPDHEFKVYTNGAIDGFPKGGKVSISNKIPVFIHESYVRGENIGRAIAEFLNTDKMKELVANHKAKSSLPEKKPIYQYSKDE